MRLIDLAYQTSTEYPSRHDPSSHAPRVWRHYQIGQGREGARFEGKHITVLQEAAREERNGYGSG
jgi:hypothetical protein